MAFPRVFPQSILRAKSGTEMIPCCLKGTAPPPADSPRRSFCCAVSAIYRPLPRAENPSNASHFPRLWSLTNLSLCVILSTMIPAAGPFGQHMPHVLFSYYPLKKRLPLSSFQRTDTKQKSDPMWDFKPSKPKSRTFVRAADIRHPSGHGIPFGPRTQDRHPDRKQFRRISAHRGQHASSYRFPAGTKTASSGKTPSPPYSKNRLPPHTASTSLTKGKTRSNSGTNVL